MNKLIILAGASGAGKSFLLEQMKNVNPNIIPIKKLSTRKPRSYEKEGTEVDLYFNCDVDKIQRQCKYVYPYGKETYGIIKEDIDCALRQGKIPAVIVRDCKEIIDIKKDYKGKTVTLYMQSGYSGTDLEKILIEQGREDIDITERDKRTKRDYEQYRKYFREFNGVLINYYEPDPLIEHFRDILDNENIKDPTKHKDIFVIMSFDAEMNNIYTEIKIAGKLIDEQINIHRVDEQGGATYAISNAILNKINEAELIICDLTKNKQNVYFELGYAMAKNKPIIIVAEKGTDIKFDVAGYKILFYKDVTDLKEKLQSNLKSFYSI